MQFLTYYVLRNKVLSSILIFPIKDAFQKDSGVEMTPNSVPRHNALLKRMDEVEATMSRLLILEEKVLELRSQVKFLRDQQIKNQTLHCGHCGKAIRKNTGIKVKNNFGMIISAFHKGCFKTILSS